MYENCNCRLWKHSQHTCPGINRNGAHHFCCNGNDTRQAEAFAKTWGIEEYTDNFDRVLDKDITTVHICTPPTLHYEMVKKVILAGKHVICEKPFCLKASEARELLELSKEKGTITAVNFNVRYHEACHRFRQKVLSPEFGNVYLIHGTYQQEFHVLPAEYMWRYQESLAGPMRATTEIGSHWIDLVRFLTGLEVNEVSATYGKFCPDRYVKDGMMYEKNVEGSEKIHVESDDAVIATLKFNNGALGCLLLSEITQGKSNYVSVEISGSSQSARWDSESPINYIAALNSKASSVRQMHLAEVSPTHSLPSSPRYIRT